MLMDTGQIFVTLQSPLNLHYQAGSLAGTVVVSSRSEGAIQTSRQLYEAVIQLESEGLTVVEQKMDVADIALSMSTCICLYTDNSQGVSTTLNMLSILLALIV